MLREPAHPRTQPDEPAGSAGLGDAELRGDPARLRDHRLRPGRGLAALLSLRAFAADAARDTSCRKPGCASSPRWSPERTIAATSGSSISSCKAGSSRSARRRGPDLAQRVRRRGLEGRLVLGRLGRHQPERRQLATQIRVVREIAEAHAAHRRVDRARLDVGPERGVLAQRLEARIREQLLQLVDGERRPRRQTRDEGPRRAAARERRPEARLDDGRGRARRQPSPRPSAPPPARPSRAARRATARASSRAAPRTRRARRRTGRRGSGRAGCARRPSARAARGARAFPRAAISR